MARVIQSVFELKDKFSPGLRKIKKGSAEYRRNLRDLKRTGVATFKAIKVGLVATSAAVVGAGVGFSALVNKTAQAGDRIDKMSQQLGLSRQGFQELDYILGQNGLSIDRLSTGMRSLTGNMDGVRKGTQGSIDLFNRLGLDSSVAALSQEEAFKKVVSAFQGMEEGAEKSYLAQQIFGASGQQLLPMLNDQEGSIESLIENYDKLGGAMSDEAIDNSVKLTDTLNDLKIGIKGAFQSLAAPALPYFSNGIQWLVDKIPLVKQFGIDAFNSIREAIDSNIERFDSVRSVFFEIKEMIVSAFGPDGEGGGAIAWLLDSAIPALVEGIAMILEKAAETYYFFRDNWSLISPLLYGIVGALTAYYTITKALIIAKHAWTAAQWALNVAMNANPLGLIVLGIGALIAVGVLLVKNWDNIKLAGQKVWNGILGAVEWGVNKYLDYLDFLIQNVLKGVNFVINQMNKIPGLDVQNVEFGIGNVDFGGAKFDTTGKEFDFGSKKKEPEDENFEDVIKDFDKEQEFKITQQKASTDNLAHELHENTSILKETRGGGNNIKVTVNGSDLTAEEIADKLIPRIERKLFA